MVFQHLLWQLVGWDWEVVAVEERECIQLHGLGETVASVSSLPPEAREGGGKLTGRTARPPQGPPSAPCYSAPLGTLLRDRDRRVSHLWLIPTRQKGKQRKKRGTGHLPAVR